MINLVQSPIVTVVAGLILAVIIFFLFLFLFRNRGRKKRAIGASDWQPRPQLGEWSSLTPQDQWEASQKPVQHTQSAWGVPQKPVQEPQLGTWGAPQTSQDQWTGSTPVQQQPGTWGAPQTPVQQPQLGAWGAQTPAKQSQLGSWRAQALVQQSQQDEWGTQTPTEQPQPVWGAREQQPMVLRCPVCQARAPIGTTICVSCHTSLAGVVPTPENMPGQGLGGLGGFMQGSGGQLAMGALDGAAAVIGGEMLLSREPSSQPIELGPVVKPVPRSQRRQVDGSSLPANQGSVVEPKKIEQLTCRIFVSHSSKDDDFGVKLSEDLRRTLGAGAVWYDSKGGLNPGDRWFQRIEEELVGRNVFLIIISPDSMNSDWVRREFDIALNEKKHIVPVLHQSCTIWPFLKTVHYVSFLPPKSYKVAFDELLKALSVGKSG